MDERLLHLSPAAIRQVSLGLAVKNMTCEQLAQELKLATIYVNKFIKGEAIDLPIFVRICEGLNLNWHDQIVRSIAEIDSGFNNPNIADDQCLFMTDNLADNLADKLVAEVRQKSYENLSNRCNRIKILGMRAPKKLEAIYVDANIIQENLPEESSEKLIAKFSEKSSAKSPERSQANAFTENRPTESADILTKISARLGEKMSERVKRDFPKAGFNEFGFSESDNYPNSPTPSEPRLNLQANIQQYSKLIIQGEAGIGKTTFLKHLTLECLRGNFRADLAPVLISLPDFAENPKTLIDYLLSAFLSYGITDAQIIVRLLEEGRLLILLDDLDQVKKPKIDTVIAEIMALADRFFRNHIFIASRESEYRLEQFFEMQIARFDAMQILAFSQKWFNQEHLARKFISALDINPLIKELAQTPLLLTSICLMFEDKFAKEGNFELDAVTVLEQCWDLQLNLSERHYLDQNLDHDYDSWHESWISACAHIALLSFDAEQNEFGQRHVENYLKSYFKSSELKAPEFKTFSKNSSLISSKSTSTDNGIELISPVTSPIKSLDKSLSKSLSKSLIKFLHKSGVFIQKSNDVYAFSRRAFQEYLAAKKIAESSNPSALEYLADRLEVRRWQNVILLAAGMLANADEFMIRLHQKANLILANQQNLQKFLDWIHKNSTNLRVPYHPSTLRAFYLDLDLNNFRIQDRNRAVEITRNQTLTRMNERDSGVKSANINRELAGSAFIPDYELASALNLHLAMYISNNSVLQLAGLLETNLESSLQALKSQLPNPKLGKEKFDYWWNSNGITWSKECRNLLIQHRKGTQEWNFSPAEEVLLRSYHDAHLLLINCLKTSTVSESTKQNIIEKMFLPI